MAMMGHRVDAGVDWDYPCHLQLTIPEPSKTFSDAAC